MPKVLVMPVIGEQDPDNAIKESYWLWCPACMDHVRITSDWEFNGNVDQPTFTPSIHTVIHSKVCHAFLTDGLWHYLDDCTHEYAGQTLSAVDVPAIGVDSAHV